MDRFTNDRPVTQPPDTTPEPSSPLIIRGRFRPQHAPNEIGRILYNNQLYFSRCEAACGALMERFIPGFRVREGETFQVPIGVDRFGHMRHVDFLVKDVLIEYHQPRFWRSKRRHGDFDSPEQFRQYRRDLLALPEDQRETFRELTKKKLALQYTAKRESQIALSLEHSGRELVVATDARDFYHKVIVRFGRNIPSEDAFAHMFCQICHRAEELSSEAGDRRRQLRRYRA